MSFLLVLTGCDYFAEDSVLQKELQKLEAGEHKYLKELLSEKWEEVCVLSPYQGGVSTGDAKKDDFYNQNISNSQISISEGHWHFVFKKGDVFHHEAFTRKPDIEQKRFDTDLMEKFGEINFIPKACVSFDKAVIYKFEVSFKEGLRTYITLGEI